MWWFRCNNCGRRLGLSGVYMIKNVSECMKCHYSCDGDIPPTGWITDGMFHPDKEDEIQ